MAKRMAPLRPLYKALYYVMQCIAQATVRLLFPVRAIGRENLPRGAGFVLAPNHLRAIDPMYVLLAYGPRKKMLVMAKAELFGHSRAVDFLWKCFGAFPVERGAGNREVLDAAVREVQNGRPLLLFPEGTRSHTGALGKLKSGAFVVAAAAGVPLVPCRIWYRAGRPKLFRRITVVFGAPVAMAELGLEGAYGPRDLREAKHRFAAILEKLHEDNAHRM